MDGINTLTKAESIISELSEADKAQLPRWLEKEVGNDFEGIEKNENIMGGAACVRQTRIPVWLLEQARRQGVSEADLLRNYPQLSANDPANAWDYVGLNKTEIEEAIFANEAEV